MAQAWPAGRREADLAIGRRPPLARTLAAIAVLALLVAMLATAKGSDPRLYPPKPGEGVTLYLIDNGFHTDLAIPRPLVMAAGGPLARATAMTTADPWVMVGWGDERFYEEEGASLDRALDGLRALFAPGNRSVAHVEGVPGDPPREWRTGVHAITVSKAGLAALLARADRAFVLGPDGAPQRSPAPREADEMFFDSGEPFSVLHLCNHWTAELLNAAGLPVTPVLDTLPAGMLLDLKLRAGI
jgi:uncharacterized protein (TIGR02117 family)